MKTKKIKVSNEIADTIEKTCENLNWKYHDSTIEGTSVTGQDISQYVAEYLDDVKNIQPIINLIMCEIVEKTKFKLKNLVRAKFNLTKKDSIQYAAPHRDSIKENHLSCVYYVNEADGDTVFFDSPDTLNIVERAKFSRGTFVLFDSRELHAKARQYSDKRIVGNFVFLIG